MMNSFKTNGTCAGYIDYEVDKNNCVKNVNFRGGCPGNTRAVSNLIEGMPVHEVIKRLKGIQCRMGTSCPDQLARALEQQFGNKK
jgi:uncharacterized protein (TIGR03905 family)